MVQNGDTGVHDVQNAHEYIMKDSVRDTVGNVTKVTHMRS